MAILRGQQARDYLAKKQGSMVQAEPQQDQGLIGNLIGGLINPFIDLGKAYLEPIAQVGQVFSSGDARNYQGTFMNPEEYKSYIDNPVGNMLQKQAGAGAFFIPGGSGIGGLVKSGLASGALSGFSQADLSDPGNILGSIGKGALTGGAVGGGMGLLGKGIGKLASRVGSEAEGGLLSGLGKKLSTMGKEQEAGALARSLGGKPLKGQGGMNLIDDMLGMGIKSMDDVENVLATQGNVIGDVAENLAQKGSTINKKEILNFLDEKIGTKTLGEFKKPLQQVRDSIEGAFSGDSIPLNDFYKLKQEVGRLGKWNQFSPTSEKQVASAFESVYGKMNDLMDNELTRQGFSKFKDINRQLSVATKAKNYIDSKASQMAGKPIGFTDIMAGMGGGVAGGPLGAAGAIGLRKMANSGMAENLIAKGLKKAGGVLEGSAPLLGNVKIPSQVSNLLGKIPMEQIVPPMVARETTKRQKLPSIDSYFQQGGGGMSQMAGKPTQASFLGAPQQGGSIGNPEQLKQLLGIGVLTGRIDPNRAKTAMSLLGMDGGGGKNLTGTQAESLASYDATLNSFNDMAKIIQQSGQQFGPTQIGGKISDLLGGIFADPEREGVKTNFGLVRSSLLKAYSGTGVSDAEREAFEKMLPTLGDSPEVANSKLRQAYNVIQNELQSKARGYQKAGYDVGGFSGAGLQNQLLG